MPFPALPSVQHTISSLPTQRTPIHPSKPTSVKSSLDSSPQLLTIFLPGRFYHLPAQKLVFGGVSSSACFSLKTGNSLVTKAAGSHLGAPPRPSGHMLRILRGQVPSTWSSSLQARRPPPHYLSPCLSHTQVPVTRTQVWVTSFKRMWTPSPQRMGGPAHSLAPIPAPFPQPLTREQLNEHRQHLCSRPWVSVPAGSGLLPFTPGR